MHISALTTIPTATQGAPAPTAPPFFARQLSSTDLDELAVCVTASLNSYRPGGYTCGTSSSCSNIDDRYFGCCDSSSCADIYTTCYTSGAAPLSCWDDPACLHCNLGSFTTECATWQLLTDTDATDALTHYFCDYSSTTYSVFGSWPTTIPEVTTSTSSYSCIAESFSADNPGDCASPIGIILPLILSNVVYFCINALAGNFKFQNWCQFWKRGRDQIEPEDYAWTPWPGLGSAALVVIQAAVTAYLVRAGGYGASFKDLILLWLVRPRMMWSQMLFYVARGIEYKGAATDAFFADVLLNLFSIPVLSSTVTIALKFKDICDAGEFVSQRYRPSVDENGTMVVRAFGSDSQTFLLSIYTYFYLAASSMGIFALAFFLYKRRLRRWWTIVPLFWSLTTFIASWLFWTSFVQFSEGVFCLRNIVAVSVIHAVFPLASTLIRVILATWSYGPENRYK